MKHPEKSIKVLNRLRQMGIDIAIDDFGTGYSSLAYLKNLPVSKLKIDRAFVKNLDESFEDRAIAKTIIALGNGLLMKVLAEGVETQEQKMFLKSQGCNLMQGYLFSKPISAKEIETHLKRGSF
jgi:EAL domain-containing protein (putative c-di-GMP-specific phosphodiesterase class I)